MTRITTIEEALKIGNTNNGFLVDRQFNSFVEMLDFCQEIWQKIGASIEIAVVCYTAAQRQLANLLGVTPVSPDEQFSLLHAGP